MKLNFNIGNTAFGSLSMFLTCLLFFVSPLKAVARRGFQLFIVLFAISSVSFAQAPPTPPASTLGLNVVNDGLIIKNTNNSVVIFGNIIHQGTGVNIENDGNIHISGDWSNTSNTSVFATGHNGWVHLDSADQVIRGTSMTHFNNLKLATSGIKYLDGADTEIEDTLDLTNREFSAGDNNVFSLSTDTFAITHTDTTGFISNTNDGGLSRNMNSMSTYLFPIGSSTGTARYRPVEIKPNDALASTFKVKFANVDPTIDGYNRATHEAEVGDINPYFYHKVERTNGISKADIRIYYDSLEDTGYDIIADWNSVPEWDNPGLADVSYNYNRKALTIRAFDVFTDYTPLALSKNVELGGEVYIPNVFSPNGDGHNDFLFARGKGIVEIQFTIYDRWGEKVFETTDINTGWDGTYKGEVLNLAVFVYVVKGKYKSGEEIDQKGNVTLLK
ncbi:MAG: gliding motility-associated C-terminal domain-containing protein [Bacteroidota bacterium]